MVAKSVDELLMDLGSDVEETRKLALIWLTQVGDERVLPSLRRMANDPSTAIRHFARRALDTVEKRTNSSVFVRPLLVQKLDGEVWRERLSDPDEAERLAAAQALARADDPLAGVMARERLPSESIGAVRAALFKIVARHQIEDDIAMILPALTDPDPTVRAEAVMALEQVKDPGVLEHLLPLTRDVDNRTRANALLLLGRHDESLIQGALRDMAFAREVWMRDSAIFVLKNLASVHALELLGRMAQDAADDPYLLPKIQKAVDDLAQMGNATALRVRKSLESGRFPQEEALIDFERVLDRIEAELRESAGPRDQRVERVGVDSLEAFVAAIADPEWKKRLSAVEAGHLFDREAVAGVLRDRLAVETHPFVVSKLVKELGRTGGDDDVSLIARFLDHPDLRVRSNTVEGLGFIGGGAIESAVRRALDDPSGRVKATAARVMFRIDREKAMKVLKEMVLARDSTVSDSAIHALGEVWTDDVLELMELALARTDQEVTLKVFKVLQRLSQKSHVASQLYQRFRRDGEGLLLGDSEPESLLRAVADSRPEVRIDAIGHLKRHPDSRARMALERALRDRDSRVARAAQAALRVHDQEIERAGILHRLGTMAYRSGHFVGDEAAFADAARKIADLGKKLDQGGDLGGVMARRNETLIGLGRSVVEMIAAGADGSAFEDLPSRVTSLDRAIDQSLAALEEERVTGPVVAGPRTGSSAAALGAPAPLEAASTGLGRWASENRSLVGGLVTVIGVLLMGLFARSLMQPSVLAGWRSPVAGLLKMQIAGDLIVGSNEAGEVIAVDARNGKTRWTVPAAGTGVPDLKADSVRAYAFSGGQLRALDLEKGTVLWEAQGLAPAVSPVVGGGAVFVASAVEPVGVRALDGARGSLRGQLALPADELRGLGWMGDSLLVVRAKLVGLVDEKLTKSLWEVPIPESIGPKGTILAASDYAVVETTTRFVGVNRQGQLLSSFPKAVGSRVLIGGAVRREVYVVTPGGVQLHDAKGKEIARAPLSGVPSVVRAGRGELFLSDAAGAVIHLTVRSASQRRLREPAGKVTDLALQDGVLMIAGSDGLESLAVSAGK